MYKYLYMYQNTMEDIQAANRSTTVQEMQYTRCLKKIVSTLKLKTLRWKLKLDTHNFWKNKVSILKNQAYSAYNIF